RIRCSASIQTSIRNDLLHAIFTNDRCSSSLSTNWRTDVKLSTLDRRSAEDLAAVMIVIAVVLAYRSTVVTMVKQWAANEMYSYAFAVLPLSAYMAWHRLR